MKRSPGLTDALAKMKIAGVAKAASMLGIVLLVLARAGLADARETVEPFRLASTVDNVKPAAATDDGQRYRNDFFQYYLRGTSDRIHADEVGAMRPRVSAGSIAKP